MTRSDYYIRQDNVRGGYSLYKKGENRRIFGPASETAVRRYFDNLIRYEKKKLLRSSNIITQGNALGAIVKYTAQCAIEQGKEVTLNTVGETAYSLALQRARYNSWTGNLENSYLVQVIKNGKIVRNFYNRSPKFAVRIKSKKGNEYVFLQTKRHNVSKSKKAHIFYHVKERKYARILEPGEAKRGYIINRNVTMSGRQNLYYTTKKITNAKSGIVMRNLAPYADRVEKQHGYRVMPYGSEARIAAQGRELCQVIINTELQRIIKRHKL